jgi:hypothetical protein
MTKWTIAILFCATLAAGACNDVGTCPSADSITPGGTCSGDSLECAFTLQTASPACDGTMVEGGVATSCVCTADKWSCPAAVSCPVPEAGQDAGADQSPSMAPDAEE